MLIEPQFLAIFKMKNLLIHDLSMICPKIKHIVSCLKQFVCKLCKERFASKTNLKEHICYYSKKKPYTCHICCEEFQGKPALHKHYFCHVEKKHNHIKVQSSSWKQLVCSFCKKKIAAKTYLKKHIHYCGKKEPYICHICSEGFWGKPALYKHYLSHGHEGKKPYTCHICSEGFWLHCDLYKHYHCHKREIPKV